ncbi:MAG TPA: MBL fold metallo-hydrolase [Halanaerobiales bacterium]|nr:MBL fold metallo-hydrolase [Halanaerobiales bacterium]
MINMKNITIKTLIDNTSANPFIMAEWGLSIYLNINGKKILFDTGAGNSQVLVNNMEVMNVNPANIDLLVLSHGHKDHTGGLRNFLRKMNRKDESKNMKIITHPAALKSQYIKNIGSFGLPFTREELEKYGAKFKVSKEPSWITDGIVVSGEIPMKNNFEKIGEGFYLKFNKKDFDEEKIIKEENELGFKTNGDKFVKDKELIDDQAIFIKTDLGLIIILGCAHRGIINTINYAREITGIDDIYMVIGGTHTANASEQRMNSTINEIKRMDVKKIGVSHCTGLVSGCKLSRELGKEIFFHNNAGSTIKYEDDSLKINEF